MTPFAIAALSALSLALYARLRRSEDGRESVGRDLIIERRNHGSTRELLASSREAQTAWKRYAEALEGELALSRVPSDEQLDRAMKTGRL